MTERVIAFSRPVNLARPYGATQNRFILSGAATGFREFVALHRGDADDILDRVGVTPDTLIQESSKLELQKYCEIFEEAARTTSNPNFGLWFGQQFHPRRLGLIGDIALHSPTLRAAITNFVENFSLYQQVTRMRLVRTENLLRLEYQIVDGRICDRRQDSELTLGVLVNIFRYSLGPSWAPEEVHFEHPRPEVSEEHNQAFHCPTFFEQRCNALIFRDTGLDHVMPQSNVPRLIQDQANLVRLCVGPGTLSLVDRAAAALRSRFPEGAPHIDEIAEELILTRRTLQRRLHEQNITYSELLERTRKTLALHYLRKTYLTISQISMLLGYSEVSAFSRACHDWFGEPPRRIRSDLLAGMNTQYPASADREFQSKIHPQLGAD